MEEKHYATREEILASPEETPPRTFRDQEGLLRMIDKMMADAEPPDKPDLAQVKAQFLKKTAESWHKSLKRAIKRAF